MASVQSARSPWYHVQVKTVVTTQIAQECRSVVMFKDVAKSARNHLSRPVHMANLSYYAYTCVSSPVARLTHQPPASLIHVRCARLNSKMSREMLSTALKVLLHAKPVKRCRLVFWVSLFPSAEVTAVMIQYNFMKDTSGVLIRMEKK